ncbi:hypothetical protein DUNSADRAFT_3598 [Dunaliella salina]|uniref:Uncharacterized protein n=1 Tax=Dunaliella salina TaxID=3046 RepID=A0ABQ7GTS4_DUNSA|nr:hypothetical protein DUNSADRAFT_3598 [Dunaliella salina]|eukprot:KAF5838007.1 hypothetical protein DUNSADRAFT_3598 [Dunaliella salina]
MGGQSDKERRVRRGVPISSRAAALALQRKEEQKAALARAKAVEDHKEAVQTYASIKLQRQKEAYDALSRLLLLCHPVELLPPASGILPVVIPTLLPLFKVVAVNRAGALVSVLDGQEQYMLDKWTLAKHGGASWPPTYSCTSAFATPMEAISEHFPSNSVMLTAPKILVQLEAVGQAYYHEKSRKWALSKARVTTLLTQLNPTDTLDVHFALNSCDAPTAPLGQHKLPGVSQRTSMEHPGVHASPSPSSEATSTSSPHANSLPSSSRIGATTTPLPNTTTTGPQGVGSQPYGDAPPPAAHTTSTVHAAHVLTPSPSHPPQQQPSDEPQNGEAFDVRTQKAPADHPRGAAASSTRQHAYSHTSSSQAAHPQHPQRFPSHPEQMQQRKGKGFIAAPACGGTLPEATNMPVTKPEQHKPRPRVSVPIERVTTPSCRPSPSTQQPAFSLPPRFDSSYRFGSYQGPVQPEQLVARTIGPSLPRRLQPSPPFQPPFDSAASCIGRSPSPHHAPFNPAAGSHSSRHPTPPPTLPTCVNDLSVGVSSRSSSREPSPPPQPRVLHPRPRLNNPSVQAPPDLKFQAPDRALPDSSPARFCLPLGHPQTHAQGGSISRQPSHMHPASTEIPPHLGWSVFDD